MARAPLAAQQGRKKLPLKANFSARQIPQVSRREMLKAAVTLIIAASINHALGRQAGTERSEEPWEKRRGTYTTDYNNTVALIRASVEEVARSLAGQTGRWDQDVLGKEIIVSEESAFIFRLRGHPWTEVVAEPWKAGLEQGLASRLATRVISYTVSDTTGVVGYSLYERGELLEEFAATDSGSGRAGSDTEFSSRLRSAKPEEIDNIWRFAEEFLIAQDAFEPGIEFRHFFGPQRHRPGERVKVLNPGLARADGSEGTSLPPIERVDYVELRPSGR